MNKALLLLLICVLGYVSAGYTPSIYWSNSGASQYEVGGKWWAYKPYFYGGSGNYWVRWYNLPYGWSDIAYKSYSGYDHHLFWPNTVRSGRYQVRCRVYDIYYKIEVEKYLIFNFRSYDRVDVFFRDEKEDKYEADYSYKFEEKDIITFPSWSKINMLIEDGDVDEISSIINRVIESDNDCDDKKDFLNGVIKRIDDFINDNEGMINDANRRIASLQSQIRNDERDIDRLRRERKYNGLSELRVKLNQALSKLAWLEKKVAESKSDLANYQSQKNVLNKKIWNIKDVEIPSLEGDIEILKSRVSDLTWKIKKNVGDVAWWEYELKGVFRTLAKKEKALREAYANIKNLEWKIDWVERKIAVLNAEIRDDESEIRKVRSYIATLRAEIADAKDTSEIDEEIEDLKMRIEDNKAKVIILEQKIKRLTWANNEIKEERNEFAITIKKSIRVCEFKENEDDYEPDEYSGYVDYSKFTYYVKSVWGSYPVSYIPASKSVYTVQAISIYSPTWYSTYGGGYDYEANYYTNSFTCTSLGRRPSRYGYITKVSANSVWAKDDDDYEWELNFSTCSSFQSATGVRYARKGDRVLWNGSWDYSGDRRYRVYKAICL